MDENEKIIEEVEVRILKHLADIGIAPRTVEKFTQISYRKLYRWLKGSFFHPTLAEYARLEGFTKLVSRVQNEWKDVMTSWNDCQHKPIKEVLYRSGPLKILSSNADFSKRVNKLTVLCFREWGKEMNGLEEKRR